MRVKPDLVDSGEAAGTSSKDAQRVKDLEQEVRELRRANAILKSEHHGHQLVGDRPRRSTHRTPTKRAGT